MQSIVSIVGTQNSGKTRLVARLVRRFKSLGVGVSTVKHAHIDFELDKKGKDSYVHFHSGADSVGIVSPKRTYVVRRRKMNPLDLARMFSTRVVILEGFREVDVPKIEVYRSALGRRAYFQGGLDVAALVSDVALSGAPVIFKESQTGRIAEFILKKCIMRP